MREITIVEYENWVKWWHTPIKQLADLGPFYDDHRNWANIKPSIQIEIHNLAYNILFEGGIHARS